MISDFLDCVQTNYSSDSVVRSITYSGCIWYQIETHSATTATSSGNTLCWLLTFAAHTAKFCIPLIRQPLWLSKRRTFSQETGVCFQCSNLCLLFSGCNMFNSFHLHNVIYQVCVIILWFRFIVSCFILKGSSSCIMLCYFLSCCAFPPLWLTWLVLPVPDKPPVSFPCVFPNLCSKCLLCVGSLWSICVPRSSPAFFFGLYLILVSKCFIISCFLVFTACLFSWSAYCSFCSTICLPGVCIWNSLLPQANQIATVKHILICLSFFFLDHRKRLRFKSTI